MRRTGLHQVEARAAELLGQTQDLRIVERGYVLTGLEAFLKPYQSALARIPPSLDELRSLVADNPAQIRRLERMRTAISEVMAESARPIELARKGDTTGAVDAVKSGRGLQVTDDFRAAFEDFYQAENDLLGKRLAAEARARSLMLALVCASLVTAAPAAIASLAMNAPISKICASIRKLCGGDARAQGNASDAAPDPEDGVGRPPGQRHCSRLQQCDDRRGNLDSVERRFGRVQSGDAAAISRPAAAARQGARRAASLTQRLLAFSRQQVLTP